MECHDAQEQLLQVEDPSLEGITAGLLADHLARCEACREFASELVRLEQAWEAIPLPESMDASREAFMQRLAKRELTVSPRVRVHRGRRVFARWLVAATVLIALGIGGGALVSLPRAAASSDVVERLVGWNLDLSRARSSDERSRIYTGQAAHLEEAVREATLPAEERELAESLLENAPWLTRNDDPLAEADRFNDVADKLVRRMSSATRGGDVRRAKRYAQLYRQVASLGIEAKLDLLPRSGALNFERRGRIERIVLHDANRMSALLSLLERAPDSTRKQIKRALGITRKNPRKPASAALPDGEPLPHSRRNRDRAHRAATTAAPVPSP